ncbi:hypothetical protein [Sphingorhabdus lutea]|nr:hypothetical protein [Sphingorhabdus lutea]
MAMAKQNVKQPFIGTEKIRVAKQIAIPKKISAKAAKANKRRVRKKAPNLSPVEALNRDEPFIITPVGSSHTAPMTSNAPFMLARKNDADEMHLFFPDAPPIMPHKFIVRAGVKRKNARPLPWCLPVKEEAGERHLLSMRRRMADGITGQNSDKLSENGPKQYRLDLGQKPLSLVEILRMQPEKNDEGPQEEEQAAHENLPRSAAPIIYKENAPWHIISYWLRSSQRRMMDKLGAIFNRSILGNKNMAEKMPPQKKVQRRSKEDVLRELANLRRENYMLKKRLQH